MIDGMIAVLPGAVKVVTASPRAAGVALSILGGLLLLALIRSRDAAQAKAEAAGPWPEGSASPELFEVELPEP